VLVGCILLVAALGVSGCSDETDQANKLIDKINVVVVQSNTLQGEVTQLVDDINKINPTSKDLPKATPKLAEARTKLDQHKKNLQEVDSLIDQIAALDVSSEMKTYMGMLKEAAKVQQQEQTVTNNLLTTVGELYDPKKASKYSQAELDALTDKLNTLIAEDSTLQAEIAEKQGAAEQYFKDNLE
jgi:uncharacterized protein (DUF3084 family)